VLDEPEPRQLREYKRKRSLFFDHCDDANTWRVIKKVKDLYIRTEA
jgi:hypothetical protein